MTLYIIGVANGDGENGFHLESGYQSDEEDCKYKHPHPALLNR